MPAHFWFPEGEEGRKRAERVGAGSRAMIRDGSFEALSEQEFGPLLKRLDPAHRKVIELDAPLLDGQDPLDDPTLCPAPAPTPGRADEILAFVWANQYLS